VKKKKMGKRNIVIPIAVMIAVVVFSVPAMAGWSYDGATLSTSSSGTVYGDVYISDGDKHNEGYWNYVTNINVPAGTTKWARLYVDAWGQNETYTGWINITFNGHACAPVFVNGTGGLVPDVGWGSGHGVWWIYCDVTSNVTQGASNQAVVTSTLGGGRIKRVILVDAYNDTDGCGHVTYYWVNDGNKNLHYNGSAGYPTDLDNTITWFNGTNECKSTAELFTIYAAGGNAGNAEPDYLYYNAFEAYQRPNQLGDDGNETWGDDDIAEKYFDMLSFDVTNLTKSTGNNATFWRGHDDDGDGWIFHDSDYQNATGAEGEAYVHPMLAVLTVNSTKDYLTKSIVGGAANLFSVPVIDSESISTALSSIEPYNFINRYNSTTQAWETYDSEYPDPPDSDFNTIDPGIGYQVAPSSARTLTWTSQVC
jgi:hypothetical protein